jgi:hypothetical protein
VTNLLQAGVLVFAVGVVVRLSTGDGFYWLALGLQLVGAALLFVNAMRSRRAGSEDRHEDTRS